MQTGITLTFDEKDLHYFGHTKYSSNKRNTIFILDNSMEILFLKKLIKALGYRIISQGDCSFNINYTEIITTYPWKKFLKKDTKTEEKSENDL